MKSNKIFMSSVLGFFGLFAVIIAIAVVKETGLVGHDAAKRGVGVIFGLMLIAVGNLLPKFHLFDSPRRDPAQTLVSERFAGWVFVIAGIAYSLTWILVPMPSVIIASSIVGLSSFALVAFDWIRRTSQNSATLTSRQPTGVSFDKRLLLGTMLLTLGWGIAMFLIDYLWGDRVTDWANIAFISLLTVGSIPLLARRPALED